MRATIEEKREPDRHGQLQRLRMLRIDTKQERAAHAFAARRREQLCGAGFAPPLAARLSVEQGYDLKELIELVERGCPPGLAVRIRAPLEREDV